MFDAIIAETAIIAECFKEHELYLVGGSIRDLILSKDLADITDLDMCTSAPPDQIKILIKDVVENLWTVGERFGTIGCIYGGRSYEITTFRKEVYELGTRKPQVEFGTDVLDDLKRRDFTVNAIALKLPEGDLIDPHNGCEDIEKKCLRTPIDSETLFKEDPLRMLRAARFEAQLGFVPVPEVLSAMNKMSDRLEIVSNERQLDEFKRLICLPDPAQALKRLTGANLLEKIMPNLDTAYLSSANFTQLSEVSTDFQVRLVAILLLATNFSDIKKVSKALSSLRLSRQDSNAIKKLATLVFLVLGYSKSKTNEEIRRLISQVKTKQIWDQIMDLVKLFDSELTEELESQVSSNTQLFNVKSALTSLEIMEALDIQPGPEVGKAQEVLKEIYFEKGELSKKEVIAELKKRLR